MSKQKKPIKKENSESVVHVRINQPSTLRKKILKAAIDSTKLIQLTIEIKSLRKHEISIANDLKKTMLEINTLEKNLNNVMPKIPQFNASQTAKNIHLAEVPKHKENSELSNLKKELELIENKLREYD